MEFALTTGDLGLDSPEERYLSRLTLRLWGYGQITLRSLAKTFSGAKGNWMELEG